MGRHHAHESVEDERSRGLWTPVLHGSTHATAGHCRRKGRSRSGPQYTAVPTGRCGGGAEGEKVRAEAVHRSRTYGICCPTQFFCDEFVQKIEANRAHENQRWIFNLIDKPEETSEVVFLNRSEWMLVQGSSYNSDVRYLVIFKDKTLKTIRDLRQKHVPMLKEVEHDVMEFLSENKIRGDYKMYFHYLPSVFQLHLHVCCSTAGDSIRRQYLHCVVRNICAKDTWYADALILFAPPRAPRAPGGHAAGNVCISEDTTADKREDVCI
jgi:hypothetical protein